MSNYNHPRKAGESIDYSFKRKYAVGTPKKLKDETGITYGTIQAIHFCGNQIWIGFANKTFIRKEMLEDVDEFELHQYF